MDHETDIDGGDDYDEPPKRKRGGRQAGAGRPLGSGGIPKVGRLDDVDDITAELRRVYRAARRYETNDLHALTGYRLSAILRVLNDLHTATEMLEKQDEILRRLDAMEAGQRKLGGNGR